jgi:hypothetical protein
MGEGVLELKIPDYSGLLIADPGRIPEKKKSALLAQFAKLASPGAAPSLAELGTADRHDFDALYLKMCGFEDVEGTLLVLERGLRALAGERSERRLSVADAKVSRRKITNVTASIDAYAARLAAGIEPHPDPRTFVEEFSQKQSIAILGDIDGPLEIGVELFNQGEVLAGDNCVARAGSVFAAQFVRGVLLIQPDLSQIDVPIGLELERAVADWVRESRLWHGKFKSAAEKTLAGLTDQRTRLAIEARALRLLHAA